MTLIGPVLPLIIFNCFNADSLRASTPKPYNVSVGYTITPPNNITLAAVCRAFFEPSKT